MSHYDEADRMLAQGAAQIDAARLFGLEHDGSAGITIAAMLGGLSTILAAQVHATLAVADAQLAAAKRRR